MISDLGLAIDYSSILEAKKAADGLENAWARMVSGIIAEERRLEAMSKATKEQVEKGYARLQQKIEADTQKHYNQLVQQKMAFERAMDRQRAREEAATLASERKKAEAVARFRSDMQAQKEREANAEAAAMQRTRDEYDRLLQQMDPVYRAQQMEAAALEKLVAMKQLDANMTQEQFEAQAQQIRQYYTGAEAINQFGIKTAWSGKNLGYWGTIMQQGGYQVQDFIVQVSNGTSVFTAFGQQGSQFAGLFGPGGAVVGAIIALVSALGIMGMAAIGTGKTFQDMASDVQKAMGDLEASTKRLEPAFSRDLAGAISVATGELENFLRKWQEIDTKVFVKSFETAKKDLMSPLRGAAQTPTSFGSAMGTQLGIEKFGTKEVDSAKELLGIYGLLEGDTIPELAQRFVVVNTLIENSLRLTEDEKKAAQEKLLVLAEGIGLQEQLDRIRSESAAKQQKIDEAAAEKLAQDREYQNSIAFAYIEKYATEYEKGRSRIQQADDMARQFRLQSMAETQAYWERYHQAQVDKGLALVRATKEEEERIRDARKEASELLAATYKAQEDMIKLDLADALKKASDNADGLAGAMFRVLGYVGSIRALLSWGNDNPTYGELFQGPVWPKEVADARAALGANRPKSKPTDIDWDLPAETKKTKGGGGGDREDPIAKLEREYNQKLRIAQLNGEALQFEEAYQDVIKAVGNDRSKYTEEFLRGKAIEMAAIQDLIDLEMDRKAVYDTIESSMTDMFMSFVDGTTSVKDAFKQMATSIIEELWRVYVVKQAVNAVMGFVGMGGAGVGDKTKVTSVNDAVISPKGDIITTHPDDFLIATKRPQDLGGGSGLIINQNFNISGSDAATVQQVLAKAMPTIVTATRGAIVDARKRGSSDLRGVF